MEIPRSQYLEKLPDLMVLSTSLAFGFYANWIKPTNP